MDSRVLASLSVLLLLAYTNSCTCQTESLHTTSSSPVTEMENRGRSTSSFPLVAETEDLGQPTSSSSPVTEAEIEDWDEPVISSPVRSNRPTIETTCTNSSMQVNLRFRRPFKGVLYTQEHAFDPMCSVITLPSSTATEVVMELLYNTCGTAMSVVDSGILFENLIIIQQHRMLTTRFDRFRNVSCILENASVEAFGHSNDTTQPNASTSSPKTIVLVEMVTGTDLFSDDSIPRNFVQTALYLVIRLTNLQRTSDMVVRYCFAHDERVVSGRTNLRQLSDFYGCPNATSMLSGFVVTNETNGRSDLMAYAMLKRNFKYSAKNRLFMTCGLNFCENACQAKCDEDESERYRHFTRTIMKNMGNMGNRPSGATTPSTLGRLEEENERAKRSVSDVIDLFHASKSLLSSIVKGSGHGLTIPAATTEPTLVTESDSDQIATNPTLDSEVTTSSTNMEKTASEVLDCGTTGSELGQISTEMHLQEMNSRKDAALSQPTTKNGSSGYDFPYGITEVLILLSLCLLIGFYICTLRKQGRN